MTTTAGVLEILIVGLVAAGWFALLLVRVGLLPMAGGPWPIADVPAWATAFAGAVALASYHLGWLVNAASHELVNRLYDNRLRKRMFGQVILHERDHEHRAAGHATYDLVLSRLYAGASEFARDDLAVDRSAIRIARSGVVNFALYSVVLIGMDAASPGWIVVTVGLLLACWLVYTNRQQRYYRRTMRR